MARRSLARGAVVEASGVHEGCGAWGDPRQVRVVQALAKALSGKIRRMELHASSEALMVD